MPKHYIDLLEILNAHADQLNRGATNRIQYPRIPPNQRQELLALFDLAEQTREALAPVSLSPDYRQRLAHDLTRMAERRTSEGIRITLRSPGREWLVGAAIGSAMAVLGGVAYLIRAHGRARSQRASQAGS